MGSIVTWAKTSWRALVKAGLRRVRRTAVLGGVISAASNRLFIRRFIPDLQHLHDLLSTSDLAGHYWMWGGLILGWAREGRVLAHDRDADFAVRVEDVGYLLDAVPTLAKGGFKPHRRYRNSDGQLTELTFRRHRTLFEFFVLDEVGDELRYYVYGWPPDNLVEVEARIPRQELVSFDFLGRTWLRHADFERELEALYGDRRTPNEDWSYLENDHAVVARRPWVYRDTSWSL